MVSPPTIRFAHPCHGATRCSACRAFQAFEDRHETLLYMMEDEAYDADRTATLMAMNKSHDPIILNVPPEVAMTVFKACGHGSQLHLGAVCRGWRKIAWACPELWTALDLRLTSSVESLPRLAREWLNRSGDKLTLSICVFERRLHDPLPVQRHSYDRTAFELIEVLNSVSHRWLDLYLWIPRKFFALFTGNNLGAPALKVLELEPMAMNKDTTAGDFVLHNSTEATPTPAHVTLGSCFGEVPLSSVKINCAFLTSARLDTSNLEDVFELLTTAQMLVLFIFQDLDSDEAIDLPSSIQAKVPRIKHDNLQELRMRPGSSQRRAEILLQSLELSALVTLYLEGFAGQGFYSGMRGVPFPTIAALLDSSSCTLKQLLLMDSLYDTSDLLMFLPLERVQSLELLLIKTDIVLGDARNLPDELFKFLANTRDNGKNNAPSILPKLEVFGFSPTTGYDLQTNPQRRFPWHYFLRCFTNPQGLDPGSKRPITNVELQFECEPRTALHDYLVLDLETARSLVDLQRQLGLNFSIFAKNNQWDMLAHYREMFDADESPLA